MNTSVNRDHAAVARILVVDDNAAMCEAISLVVEDEADLMICAQAQNSDAALEALKAEHPDAVMIDLSLRGEDGLELIPKIRSTAPSTPILVFSLHDDPRNIERVRDAGADGYASKRRGPDDLIAALRGVLDGRRPFHAPGQA